MKVSKAIEYLMKFPQDEELFINWWDKEYAETAIEQDISDEVWSIAIKKTNNLDYWSEATSMCLTDMVEDTLREARDKTGENKGMNSIDEIVSLAERLVELTGGKVNG